MCKKIIKKQEGKRQKINEKGKEKRRLKRVFKGSLRLLNVFSIGHL